MCRRWWCWNAILFSLSTFHAISQCISIFTISLTRLPLEWLAIVNLIEAHFTYQSVGEQRQYLNEQLAGALVDVLLNPN